MNKTEADIDPFDILPWSPQIIEKEKRARSPNAHLDTPHPRKIHFSPRMQFTQVIALELDPIPENQESDLEPQTPQFDSDKLPWSPLSRAPLDIAYIFGNYRHPLVEKIIPLLQLKYDIQLISSVSAQPPKPFPLFYLYTEGDNISKVLRVGNGCSDGHCIIIFPDDKNLPEDLLTYECIKLQITADNTDYDPQALDQLCQQMSDCTKEVYAKDSKLEKSF